MDVSNTCNLLSLAHKVLTIAADHSKYNIDLLHIPVNHLYKLMRQSTSNTGLYVLFTVTKNTNGSGYGISQTKLIRKLMHFDAHHPISVT